MTIKEYIGNGLSLFETKKGTLIWKMKYTYQGSQSSLSIGDSTLVDRSEAIKRCEECRVLIAKGKNPRDHRSWLRPKADYAKEYLIESIEKKAEELMKLIALMRKQT
jgi:sulfatase maturation enzyme AslB (radical SAM superfamily)